MRVQASRFETWARKLLSGKGGTFFTGVDPLMGLSLDPLTGQVYDQLYLTGAAPFAIGATFAALAGNRNRYQLYNPAGSGLMMVITGYQCSSSGIPEVVWVSGGGAPFIGGAAQVPATLDWRIVGAASGQAVMPPCFVADQNAAVIPGITAGRAQLTSGVATFPWGVVLTPGGAFGHYTGANVNDSVTITGYVRDLLPSERSA